MKRFPRLEIYWSILHLKQHVRRNLPVEWLKVLVGRAGTIVAGLHVVDKRTPHHDAVMRGERRCKHVCAINVIAIVGSWTGLSFAVCFDDEAAEIRDHTIDLIGLLLPPLNNC